MSYLSLEEINSNPIYQPPIEWIVDYKKKIASKFSNRDCNSHVWVDIQIEKFESFDNELKHKIMYCYNNYTSKTLKEKLKIQKPLEYKQLCKDCRKCNMSPYFWDLTLLYCK